MAATAIVAHRIPGRVRLLIHEKRGDHAYFSRLSEKLSRLPTARATKINPERGSIVLEFAGNFLDLIDQAERQELFTIGKKQEDFSFFKPPPPKQNEAPLNIVSGREIDSMFMLGTFLLGLAMLQVMKGQLLPPALSIFSRAIQAFRASGKLD